MSIRHYPTFILLFVMLSLTVAAEDIYIFPGTCSGSGSNGSSFMSGNGTIWTLTDDFGTPVVALNSSLLADDVTINLTNAVQLWKAGSDYILETKGDTRLLVGTIADFTPTEIMLKKEVSLDNDIGLQNLWTKVYFGDVQNYITFDSYGNTQNQYHAFGQGGRYYIATTENIFDDMVHNVTYWDNNSVNFLVDMYAGNIYSDGDNVTNFIRNHTSGGSGGANLSLYDIFVPYNGSVRNVDVSPYNLTTNGTINSTNLVLYGAATDALPLGCEFIKQSADGTLSGQNCLSIWDMPVDYLPLTLTGATTVNHAGNGLTHNIGQIGSFFALQNTAGVTKLYGANMGSPSITFPSVTGTLYGSGAADVTVADGGTGRSSHTAYSLLAGGTSITAAQQSIANSATVGTILRSAGTSVLPAWSIATYPSTATTGRVMIATGTNVYDGSSALTFEGGGNLTVTADMPGLKLLDKTVGDSDAYFYLDKDVVTLYMDDAVSLQPMASFDSNGKIIFGGGNVADVVFSKIDDVNFTICRIEGDTGELIGFSGHNNLAGGKVSAGVGNFTGNVTVGVNMNVTGNVSFKRYYYSGYDNSTQLFLNTANTQVVNVSNNEDFDSYGINIVDKQNITFEHTGDYMITFMPQFFQQSGTNKEIEFWIEKNSVDVPYSNSRYTMENLDYLAPSIVWQLDITNPATDRVRIMWYSTSTNTAISSITGLTTPTRPSIPGVILNIQKVSEIT